jgi:hypothetical protein
MLAGRVTWQGLPALAAFVAASAVLLVTVAAEGHDPLAAASWMRWDSEHYVSIASRGYFLEPCDVNPHNWCGNAGQFPGYPWLLGLVSLLGGASVGTIGVAVSWLFALGFLLLLRGTFLAGLPARAVAGGLVLAAFFPGVTYRRAVFPLSMVAFFSIAALWFAARERWVLAGLATAVAGASYHLGLVLIPLIAVYAFLSGRGEGLREALRRAGIAGGLALLGPLAVIAAMGMETGSWDAFLLVQEKYGHGLHSPVVGLRDTLSPLYEGASSLLAAVPAIQVLFVTVIVGLATATVVRRRATAPPSDWLLLAATLALFTVPLTQDNAGLYRTAAALVPAVPLVARLPTPVLAVCCLVAAVLSVPMTVLFARGSIV